MESDLISRSALRRTLEMRNMTELYPEWRTLSLGMKEKIGRLAGAFRKAIDSAPVIDAVLVAPARWTEEGQCTRCGTMSFCFVYDEKIGKVDVKQGNYCPVCGARMDAEAEDAQTG